MLGKEDEKGGKTGKYCTVEDETKCAENDVQ